MSARSVGRDRIRNVATMHREGHYGAALVAYTPLAAFGFLVGTGTILSHIAADAPTPMGVRPFAPLDGRHVSLDLVRAANPVANYALLVVGVAVAAGGYAAANSV